MKYIVSCSGNIIKKYLVTNKCSANGFTKMQDINGEFLEALTGKKAEVLPMKINLPETENKIVEKLDKIKGNKDMIGLTCISKAVEKDMPIKTAASIIILLNQQNKFPVLLGVGKSTRKYANDLKKMGILEFVDLVDITSIIDIMQILNRCKALISVDTGTIHMACALNIPVTAVFYKKSNVEKWAPDRKLYKCEITTESFSAEHIVQKTEEMINKSF